MLVRLRGQLAAALSAGLQRQNGAALAHCRARPERPRPAPGQPAVGGAAGACLGSRRGAGPDRPGHRGRRRLAGPRAELDGTQPRRRVAGGRTAGVRRDQRGPCLAARGAGQDAGRRAPDAAAPDAAPAPAPTGCRPSRRSSRTGSGGPPGGLARWPGTSVAPVTAGGLRDRLGGRVLVAYGRLRDDLMAVVIEPRRSRIDPSRPAAAGPRAAARAAVRAAAPGPDPARRRAGRRPGQRGPAHPPADRAAGRAAGAESPTPSWSSSRCPAWTASPGRPCTAARYAWPPRRPSGPAPRTAPRPCPHPARAANVALVAGPGLPGAIEEVGSLARLYPSAQPIMPPDSTADAVAGALAGADLAHLACHGALRADNPMFSSLVLSDGPMTVQELYARGLAPRRLILASCESGSQASYAGDEVLGFVGALLARGAASHPRQCRRRSGRAGRRPHDRRAPSPGRRLHPRPRAAWGPAVTGHRGARGVRQLVHVQRPWGRLKACGFPIGKVLSMRQQG